jgi:hypothetical protein
MKYISHIETRGTVTFPEFTGERVYMRGFLQRDGLPADLVRWQPVVDSLLDGIETDQPIYIMVDEGFVRAGSAQRREGLHIDGYWNPGLQAHGNDTGGHGSVPRGHGYVPPSGHRSIPAGHGHTPPSGHGSVPPSRHGSGATAWHHADFKAPEGLILASSVSAARGYVGEFLGPIGEGGDCSAIDLSGLRIMPMDAGIVYAGNVTALHESLPVERDCYRQLVRLNVPGWSPDVQ